MNNSAWSVVSVLEFLCNKSLFGRLFILLSLMFLFKEEGILNYSGKVLANQFRTQISKEMADFDKTAER